MVEKRSTLTLGQKIGSKNKELEMSNDIKSQLLLRQQKLKVSQKDKIIENRQKQEEEKREFEAAKRAEERKIHENKIIEEENRKRFEQQKTEPTKKLVKKLHKPCFYRKMIKLWDRFSVENPENALVRP